MSQKPRILNDYKDLFWSLIPLVLLAVVFAGLASQCSFAANGPTQGRIPHFDVTAALREDARTLHFPIRNPAVPQDWQPNSGRRDTITGPGGGPLTTVGYITPQGNYMQVTQTSGAEPALARHLLDGRYGGGSQQIGEQKWVVYAEKGEETAWIADFGQARVLIKGAGSDADFRTLAQAVTSAQPVRP
ncbi:DUF4245 domain-containing protein [Nocardia panacis]|uniref:DUF4245 domain-containing protein n=1 Tax=Nocardia panacis TaxID=2340916 RepID=A0A3A4L1E6_9NOCA|nr:DUF4245 domain-containing protein [Nocardia panacis]RJO75805.1 DUF4245 domain-containing protein [Nocardia panacis]